MRCYELMQAAAPESIQCRRWRLPAFLGSQVSVAHYCLLKGGLLTVDAALLTAPVSGSGQPQQMGMGLLSALKSQSRPAFEPAPPAQRTQSVLTADRLANATCTQPVPPALGAKDFLQRVKAALNDVDYARVRATTSCRRTCNA